MNSSEPAAVPESFDDWLYDPPALPVEPLIPAWMWWTLVGLTLLSAFFVVRYIRQQMRIPVLPQPPRTEALVILDGLSHRIATLPPSEMASELASVMNRYLHRRYGELAGYRTRDEVFDPSLRPEGASPLPPGVRERFSALMESCEEMRFAGRESAKDEIRKTIDAAIKAIREESPLVVGDSHQPGVANKGLVS